jgi:predicted nucleic acid-binding protein
MIGVVSMKSKIIIDTYAWIEYFRGTQRGAMAKEHIESGQSLTPTLVLAELSDKYKREDINSLEEDITFIKSVSELMPLTEDIAIWAGNINSKMKKSINGWGMADSIILATAQKIKADVLTGDQHFKSLKESIII